LPTVRSCHATDYRTRLEGAQTGATAAEATTVDVVVRQDHSVPDLGLTQKLQRDENRERVLRGLDSANDGDED